MSASELRRLGYKALGILEEDVRAGVQINEALKQISAVIRRAGQPQVTRKIVDSASGITVSSKGVRSVDVVEDTKYLPPYGPASDVHKAWPWYLETSDSMEGQKVLGAYYSLGKQMRRAMPIEAFCLAAKVPPLNILGVITATCVRLGVQASTIISAVNHPRVVQKTVEMALTDEGIEDRITLHKAVGFLPQPKGAQTTIQVMQNTNTQANAQSAAAPPAEQTIRRMVNRFNERPLLAADTGSVRIPEVMPHEDLEPVTVEADGEEEEAELTP